MPGNAWRKAHPSLQTFACAAFIFLLNCTIVLRLFRADWVAHMFSIESAYISLTRYIMENFPDLSWFPLWLDGEPFQSTYQPGLPLLSALVSRLLHTDAAHGYHVTIALFYCLGPVGMFFLGYRLSGRRQTGLIAALLFSLFSPSALIPAIRTDVGGLFHARRFQALAFYGEGPNVSGLNVVPFALLGIHAVYRRLTALRFALAALAIGLTVLVSWPASVVLALGAVAYLLARDWKVARTRLLPMGALALTAYLLICPLDLPSTIRDNQRNSQTIGGTYRYTPAHILYFGLFLMALAISRIALRRLGVPRLFEMGWYWFLATGSVAISAFIWHIALLPQPERFHVGMELGVALFAAVGAAALLDRCGRYRPLAIGILALLVIVQTRVYMHYVRGVVRPIDITGTYEYQFARWMDGHLHGLRVFANGDLQFWLNAFSDQPQAYGCCLPGMPNPISGIFLYVVPSTIADPALDEAAPELWLRTWGVQALVESGPRTRDAYQGWAHPHKFDRHFRLIHEKGDDRIYRIPARTASLAHVIEPAAAISRVPVNGLDLEPLRPYVHALEDPALPLASFAWVNRHAAEIAVDLPPHDWISIQETWHPGWRASSAGHSIALRRDAMGFILLEPSSAGPMKIDLVFDGGAEARIFTLISVAAWSGLLVWCAMSFRKRA